MELKMRIQNVKCIKDMQFTFPLEKGIYAITGENGSGKSTLIACASTVFYQMAMNDYFGKPQDASIEFSMGTATRGWSYNGRKWAQNSSNERMPINGFYEGALFLVIVLKIQNFLPFASWIVLNLATCWKQMIL